MARIEPLAREKMGFASRMLLRLGSRAMKKRVGQESDAMAFLAHQPQVLYAAAAYMAFQDRWKRLPRRTRRLVHLRVAMRVGCPS